MQVFFLFSGEDWLGGCRVRVIALRLCTVGHVAFFYGYGASMPLLWKIAHRRNYGFVGSVGICSCL